MNKETIIKDIRKLNHKYEEQGFKIVSLFGSYARDSYDIYSDIDLTYKINHDKFFKDDAFAKLEKIEEIKEELEHLFHKKVDLIPANTTNYLLQDTLQKEQAYV